MQKQTVKIFLAEGNPTGLRSLELFNWNGKGFIIPRDRIDIALKREELLTQGVYILVGENKESEQEIYVGESENIAERIRSHHKTKDFWDTVICFFSKDENLNKAHVKFLEELIIFEASNAGRVNLQNGNQPKQTRLSESDEAEILLFANNIKLILASVGYTFLKKPVEYEEESNDIYVCKGPFAIARALYTSEGIVVLEGSLTRKEFVNSVDQSDAIRRNRQELIDSGVLTVEGGTQYRFIKEYVFTNPSRSASVILARHADGWNEWKRESDGKTLDKTIRQEVKNDVAGDV